ncbi:hypothetical protein [Mangrovibacterium marinum]|uniref:hypothetical protein n=1 Tax=Mangrovibacterium marinum TaxID=1639118 RepID=UPI002A18A49D|nr:hypothetical protein [Mangrovibacterium marinum]
MNFKNKLRFPKPLAVIVAVCSTLAVLLGVSGCNSENEEIINSLPYDDISLLTMNYSDLKEIKSDGFYWSSEEANLIGLRFLKLDEDGKYTLNLTYQDAMELHIHQSDFERMVSEINIANDSVARWSRDKNIVLELSNPEDFIKSKLQIDKSYKIRLKSSNVEEPGERTVSVSTSGLDWGSTVFWLPTDAVIPLNVSCYSPITFTPAFNIKVYTCGNEVIKSGVGLNGIWNTTITPACSNTNCKFSFKTSSTNGGTGTLKY